MFSLEYLSLKNLGGLPGQCVIMVESAVPKHWSSFLVCSEEYLGWVAVGNPLMGSISSHNWTANLDETEHMAG